MKKILFTVLAWILIFYLQKHFKYFIVNDEVKAVI